jgi:hypothetical protein
MAVQADALDWNLSRSQPLALYFHIHHPDVALTVLNRKKEPRTVGCVVTSD